MGTKLGRIEEMSAKNPKMIFTSLYHLINEDLLRECHEQIDGRKAVGIDFVTKAEYEVKLAENLKGLVTRLKEKSYKPQPSRRVYIPKANGEKRPIGMAAYEDKLVQSALSKILMAVYEPKLSNHMYGFRPNRDCHGALKALTRLVESGRTSYIVEADIKGFFNNMSHDRIIDAIRFRIADPNILWLVKKILTAGVVDEGKWQPTVKGAEQGNLASPIIANVFMNYTLALWYDLVFMRKCRGDSGLVVYADDFIATFQAKDDAMQFLSEIKERFSKVGLELEPSKTRLIEFGRFAEINRKKRGLGKPETFDFLGFTHYCSKSHTTGKFRMKRKTAQKKYRMRLIGMNVWLKRNRHLFLKDLFKILNSKLRGYYHYYGITDNFYSLKKYLFQIERLLFKWLNRRSQKKSYDWDGFKQLLKIFPLEKPRIYYNVYS